MFPKSFLGLPTQGWAIRARSARWLLGLASKRICWHSSVRAALVSACFSICSCYTRGDTHWCKAHLEGSSEERLSPRLCSLPKRLYKEEKCRASCLTSPSCCHPQTQGVATSYSGSQGDVWSWSQYACRKGRRPKPDWGTFLQCHLPAETYCSNVWESKLS